MRLKHLLFFMVAFLLATMSFSQVPNAWINEIHYDDNNSTGDLNESVEVVVENPGSWDLSLLNVIRYNGSGGVVYGTDAVSTFSIGTTYGDFTVYYIVYPANGMQNGSPDGVALSYNGIHIQFLSYEGAFTATAGDASGVLSTDIVVSESSSTPVGTSLQLSGTGSGYASFSWQSSAAATLGSANNSQTIEADAIAPTAVYTPAPNATGVDISANITVNYGEHVYKIDGSEIEDGTTGVITLRKAGADIPFALTIDANKELITIDPTSNLDFSSTYNVSASVEDAAGNESVTSINFTTRAAYSNVTVTSSIYTVDDDAGTITNVPMSTSLGDFKTNLTPATGATFEVYTDGTYGTVATDLQTDYVVKVTAEDGSTTKDYTVTLSTIASTDASVTSSVYTVSTVEPYTITGVPWNEEIETFIGNLSPALGAEFTVYTDGTYGTVATDLQTGYVVKVTAEDETTTRTYAITLDPHIIVTSPNLVTDKYYAGQNVTITWTQHNMASENVKIEAYIKNASGVLDWVEIAASTEGDGTFDYTIPSDVMYSNACKVRVTGVVSTTATDESDAAFSIVAIASNITNLKAFADNDIVKLTGEAVISFIRTANRNHKYIQDANAGILIDDNSAVITGSFNIGDGITGLEGKLGTFSGVRQFVPQVDPGAASSTGNVITPIVLTVDELKTTYLQYQSMLVKVVDVVIKEANGTATFAATSSYTIQDGAAVEATLRQNWKAGETDLIGSVIPTGPLAVYGIGTVFSSAGQISPRTTADLVSMDATLTDLKINDVTVTGFDAATLIYNVELPFGAAVPAVAATATSTSATLDITQATVVDGGVATVLVTAQDGVTTKTYTVNFTEGSPSTDASVTSTIYNVNAVEKSITGIPVTATLAEFKSNLTPATGATFEVYQADGTTVATNLATGYKVVVTAQDGIAKSTYTITLNTVLSSEANILTYSLLGVNATISSTGYTVTLTLPYGTSLDNLVATFTLSPAATAKVNDVVQVSGTTANSYSSALLYVITAEDGTIVNWTVTVTLEAPSSEASVTSTLYTVNSTDATITSVPFGTLLVDFKAAITPAANAVFEVYQPDGTTVATDLNSGYKLIVTAQDGSTKKVYTITIDEAPAVDLFFSEYIEGSSNNKAIEIYNPTGTAVDLSRYSVKLAPNGGAWNAKPQALTGTLASGEVFVITNADAGTEIKAQSDLTSTVTYFNGDDALGLFKDDVLIDVIGKQGEDPGTAWSVAGIDGATVDHTLVRRGNVVVGTTDWAASAGTNADDSQWIVNAKDDFTTLGTHSTALSSAAEITAFSFAEQVAAATIDATSGTITIEVVYGTDLTGLVSTFTVSAGAKAYVNDVLQVSGTTANNFTNEVVYKVVAEDGTIKEWTVTVTMPAQPSTAAEIVSFVLAEQTGAATINSTAGTIAIEVNSTADLTALTPTIQVSAGASISPASGAVQDFTNPVTFTVTAQDNTTTKAWTVTVTKPQVNVVTIAQIQQTTGETGDSPYANQIVETTGIVTAIQAGKGFFIQDGEGAWSGILVYTNTATGLPAIGDEVKVKGWLKEYYNYTEITNNTSPAVTVETTVLSTGNTLPAATVLTSQAVQAEEYEGVLVKVVSAEVISGPSDKQEYIVNDGSGELTVDDKLFLATFTVGTRYSITGVMDYSFDAFKLLPRDASDIATGIDDVKWGVNLEVYPNPFTNTINFSNVEDVELITVTNLIGQRVMTVKPESSNSINTDNLIKGIYLVSFQNRDGKVIVKKMIKQ